MSNILIISDGPLGADLVIALGRLRKTHKTRWYHFPAFMKSPDPLENLPNFLQNIEEPVDLIIEALIANRNTKREAIKIIAKALPYEKPLFSASLNASSTEVGEWVAYTKFACEVVGWSTIPPFDNAKLVEILPSVSGNVQLACDFFTSLGKEPVIIKDCVGGVLPRVVASLINNAAYALMEGVASAADIDAAMKLGTNYPFGPLEWADKIGLDQVLGILEALCEAHGQDRYRPAPILRQLAYAGDLGDSVERGFYKNY